MRPAAKAATVVGVPLATVVLSAGYSRAYCAATIWLAVVLSAGASSSAMTATTMSPPTAMLSAWA